MMKPQRSLLTIVLVISLLAFPTACSQKQEEIKDQNTPLNLVLYYPYDTGTDVAIAEVIVQVKLTHNETKLEKLNYYLKNPVSQNGRDFLPILKDDAKVQSVVLQDNNVATVNVNRQFIEKMNAGASFEEAIVKSLAKTISSNYNVEGIILLVEGQAYESGHLSFKSDEIISGK